MSPQQQNYDVIVLGAGASGLLCASVAANRGRSVLVLENALRKNGTDTGYLWDDNAKWDASDAIVAGWIDNAARHIAFVVASTHRLLDLEAIIIEGLFPADIRQRLVDEVRVELARLDVDGIENPTVIPGSLGRAVLVIGSACLPLIADYFLDHSVLFK